jgi:hypothetical protein
VDLEVERAVEGTGEISVVPDGGSVVCFIEMDTSDDDSAREVTD